MRWSDHVFLRRNEFDHAVVEIGTQRTIGGLLQCRIPIEGLWHIVRQITHVTTPAVAMVKEGDEGVDIGAATSASGDDLVWNHRNGVLGVVKRSIRLDDKGEGQL